MIRWPAFPHDLSIMNVKKIIDDIDNDILKKFEALHEGYMEIMDEVIECYVFFANDLGTLEKLRLIYIKKYCESYARSFGAKAIHAELALRGLLSKYRGSSDKERAIKSLISRLGCFVQAVDAAAKAEMKVSYEKAKRDLKVGRAAS